MKTFFLYLEQMYGKDFGIPNIKQYLTVCSIPSLSLLLLPPLLLPPITPNNNTPYNSPHLLIINPSIFHEV